MLPPHKSEYGNYYANYVATSPSDEVVQALEDQGRATAAFLRGISEEQSTFRYAEGKWSIREIVGHLADGERVFVYRALRIARGDKTPMAGFDENAYVPASGAHELPLPTLAADLATVRASTISFFRTVSSEQESLTGTASGSVFSVRALAHIIVGHEIHHMNVIRDKYLR